MADFLNPYCLKIYVCVVIEFQQTSKKISQTIAHRAMPDISLSYSMS